MNQQMLAFQRYYGNESLIKLMLFLDRCALVWWRWKLNSYSAGEDLIIS